MPENICEGVFTLAATCWAHVAARRPSITQLLAGLQALQSRASAALPAMRDIGAECYRVLEENKSPRRPGQRGGSIIRS